MKDPFIWFSDTKNGWWGTSPSTWNFGPNWPYPLPRFKNGDFPSIFAHTASALRRSENVQLHVSRLQAFQWTAYVAPLLRILKREGAHKCKLTIFIFLYKKCTSVEKVCCKVSLCENFQSQSCKAFTGLSSRAQMVGGDCPLLSEIWTKVTHAFKNGDFLSIFVRTASAVKPSEKVQLSLIGTPLGAFQWG